MPSAKYIRSAGPQASARTRHSGFTTVELVVTIVIAGILAAFATARYVGRDTFDSRAFHDLAMTSVRFAQKTAIARRRNIYVCVGANSVLAGTAAGCGVPIINPGTGQPVGAAYAGVSLAGPSFSFDSAGRPNPNSQTIITFSSTVPGDPARQIVIEAETGYVHP